MKIEREINFCNKHLHNLNAHFWGADLTIGANQHFMARITNIKSCMLEVLNTQTVSSRVEWKDQSAFHIRTDVIVNLKHKNVAAFLNDAAPLFRQRTKNILKKVEGLKIKAVLCGEFLLNNRDKKIVELKYFTTKNASVYRNTDIVEWFTSHVREPIMNQLEEFQEEKSDRELLDISYLMININRLVQLSGTSYIELPEFIKRKRACINVKNKDDACFAWAVVSALHRARYGQHSDRTSSYPHYSSVLNLENIVMPMTMKQIPHFEQQNSISIDVDTLKKTGKKFKVKLSCPTETKQSKHVNLLLIQDNYDQNNAASVKYHYVWIKSLSRLLSCQLSKHKGKNYFCDRCRNYFYSRDTLNKHAEDCEELNHCKIKMPTTENNILKFKNFKNKIAVPFVIYAGLKCLSVPCANENKFQERLPYSVGYYLKCSYDESLSLYRSYRGKNCMQWFTAELRQFAEDVETVFLCSLPIEPLTTIENRKFSEAVTCHICEKPFILESKKVRDHCHLTGKFRGAAHEGCNINYKHGHVVPVVFHNLSSCDSHFLIKSLALNFEGRLDLLPVNKEKYILFTKHVDKNLVKFRFIDSFSFMSSSLDKLASKLETYPILKSEFQNLPEEKFQLQTRKSVYPYDYFDSFERFTESKFPAKGEFYDKLKGADISDDDYAHAQHMWVQFQIQNLGQYSDLHLRTDVLLLADVYEQFRWTLLKTYGLDPARYSSSLEYSWDAMLKYTQVELELLTDIDMLVFIERGVRGGLSQCSKRYAKSNNKYMTDYDPTRPSNYLLYQGVSDLCGYALSQRVPYGGFSWVKDIEHFDINISNDGSVGYILEVDLEYPADVHRVHSDLPFCPEYISATKSKEQKLMATFHNKERYVIYYNNLKQVLAHGLKLIKIHRVLKFNQAAWLKPYISLNITLRTTAKNDFEKYMYKLLNKAAFGKTLENIRKLTVVKLVTKWNGRYGAAKLIAKPEFKSSTAFSENLVAIELNKTDFSFNNPIYVGMCVLDIAKAKLYEFHYEYMKPQFGNECKLCYTDTDSLIYEIECDDVYEIFRRDCHEFFDTSRYPENNRYGIPRANKNVTGLMKDKLNGKIMTEFVGLRSKCYTYKVEGEGTEKNIIRNKITFDDYLECLKNFKEKFQEQSVIRSEKHSVRTVTHALSPHDDKRYIISDSYETLPWGHHDIMDK